MQTERRDEPKPPQGVESSYSETGKRSCDTAPGAKSENRLYSFTVYDLEGNTVRLDKYRGKAVLVVNIATQALMADKNMDQLQEIYDKYRDRVAILAFPSNQFGGEPGSNAEIKQYLKLKNITFEVFGKIDVNGDKADPLFVWLKSQEHGFISDDLKWNFTKFLVDPQGRPVNRYAPESPFDITKDIEKLVGAPSG